MSYTTPDLWQIALTDAGFTGSVPDMVNDWLQHVGGDSPPQVGDVRYLSGNAVTDDSFRFRITSDYKVALERRVSGIWQLTSMKTGPASLWVGDQVGVGAVGHHLVTEGADGHMHFHAHAPFDPTTGLTTDATILSALSYEEHMAVVTDDSGTWAGTKYSYNYPSTDHRIFKYVYFKMGPIVSSDMMEVCVYEGADDTGPCIFQQKYPASEFTAATEVKLAAAGYLEFDKDINYHVVIESASDFSLRTTSDLNYPYTYGDISIVEEAAMLQTSPYVDGNTYAEHQYLIVDRTIYVCNTTGVQTGTFASNAAKWDALDSDITTSGPYYLKGDETTEGSVRVRYDEDYHITMLEKMEDSIWGPSSFQPSTVELGKVVKLAAVGHHLSSRSPDGHLHFFATSNYDQFSGVTTGDATIINISLMQTIEIQSDYSEEWSGTLLGFGINSPAHMITGPAEYKTGSVAATANVRIRSYKGDSATGQIMFDQTYAPSFFPANSNITLTPNVQQEYEKDVGYFLTYESDEAFSLKVDSFDIPYLKVRASFVNEDALLQTSPWIPDYDWTNGDWLIQDRKIWICNTSGVQDNFFVDHLDKWDVMASVADVLEAIAEQRGTANGLAALDSGGKVPVSQLPTAMMEYQGQWNANTNTPTLADGTGTGGDVWIVSVAGIQDLGSGDISFAENDWAVYNGSIWQQSEHTDEVFSVNGYTGTVNLDLDDIDDTASYEKATPAEIISWNEAYGWGDHGGAYLPITGGTLTGALDVEGDLTLGEDGVSNGKLTFYDSGTIIGHPEILTNSDGDLQLRATANGALIENVLDGFNGWFVVSDDTVSGLMTIKHTTGDMYLKGNLGVGKTASTKLDVDGMIMGTSMGISDTNDSTVSLQMINAGTGNVLIDFTSDTENYMIGIDASDDHKFKFAGGFTIDPSNNVEMMGDLTTDGATIQGHTAIDSSSDALDVTGKSVFVVSTTGGNVTIGGFANGVTGQRITIIKEDFDNDIVLEHNETSGTQKIWTHNATDLVMTGHGGVDLIYEAPYWFLITC